MKKVTNSGVSAVVGWLFRQALIALVQVLLPFDVVRDYFDDVFSGR
ncbi:TPA: hypothetical protein ACQQJD_004950 [Pseudomonas aeruginosa]